MTYFHTCPKCAACRSHGLQRAFGSDLLKCQYGGRKRVIAVIRAGPVADRILRRMHVAAGSNDATQIRGPPEAGKSDAREYMER